MKKLILNFLTIGLVAVALHGARAQDIQIVSTINVLGKPKPIPVWLDGFTGEAAEVLKFDLFVQGFSFAAPEAAPHQVICISSGDVSGSVTDKFAKKVVLSRSYNGASVRRQAH